MSNDNNRYADTHLLDGMSCLDTIKFFAVVGKWFILGIFWLIIQPFFWWAVRLNFLQHSDEILLRYGIDDPTKARRHAWAGAVTFVLATVFIELWWVFGSAVALLVALLSALIYAGFTAAYYMNKNDDPVAGGWG